MRFVILICCLLLITACSPEQRFENQLDAAVNEPFAYTKFVQDGFSAEYPVWPQSDGDSEVSVSRGYCSVAINVEKLSAKQWYGMLLDAVKQQDGKVLVADDAELHAKFSTRVQNITLISDNRLYECNGNAIVVTMSCIDNVVEQTMDINEHIFSSAKCDGEQAPTVQETTYKTFKEDDFSLKIPEWDALQEDHIVGVSQGGCSIILDKHNALPTDILDWLQRAIIEQDDHKLVTVKDNALVYELDYEGNAITASAQVEYCNYQSYITQVLCVDELMTADFEDVREEVLDSVRCAKHYEPPTPVVVKEKKQQVIAEEPEVIEKIEDEIVKTNAGDEFGIDEELVVYFINNNAFFTKVMRDFPKANIIIEAGDKQLELSVRIDDQGKIASLEDGAYSDANVALTVPLRDALNIFGNANSINPLTLIGFAVNVQTDPPEIKDQVIQKVLRGEYK